MAAFVQSVSTGAALSISMQSIRQVSLGLPSIR